MKAALSLIAVPYALFFLGGMFGWYMEEGLTTLLSFGMLGGIIWAWGIELRK